MYMKNYLYKHERNEEERKEEKETNKQTYYVYRQHIVHTNNSHQLRKIVSQPQWLRKKIKNSFNGSI